MYQTYRIYSIVVSRPRVVARCTLLSSCDGYVSVLAGSPNLCIL